MAASLSNPSQAKADTTADTIKSFGPAIGYVCAGHATASAFCIHESGIFVTSSEILHDAEKSNLSLICNSHDTLRRFPAEVLVDDDISGLAVLKAPRGGTATVLQLGESESIHEGQDLAALGFPHTEGAAPNSKTASSLKATPLRVSNLRKRREGSIDVLQLNSSLDPANAGSPLIDGSGKVIGIVAAGVSGKSTQFAIPVSSLRALIKNPLLTLAVPKVKSEDAAKPVEVSVSVSWVFPPQKDPDVTLELRGDRGLKNYQTARRNDGQFYALITPSDAIGDAKTCGKVTCKALVVVPGGPTIGSLEKTLLALPKTAEYAGENTGPGQSSEAQHIPQAGDETSFAEPIGDLQSGQCGCCIVAYLKDSRRLAIFDVLLGKIRGYISLGDSEIRFAAGAKSVLVYEPASKMFERFSLETLQREAVARNSFGEIDNIVLGHSVPSTALAILKDGFIGKAVLFDLDKMACIGAVKSADKTYSQPGPFSRDQNTYTPPNSPNFLNAAIRASGDGSTYICFSGGISTLLTLREGKFKSDMLRELRTVSALGDDGSQVYARGGVFSATEERLFGKDGQSGSADRTTYIPSFDPCFFLGINHASGPDFGAESVSIYHSGNSVPLAEANDAIPEMISGHDRASKPSNNSPEDRTLSEDKRYFFYPQFDTFVTVPKTNDRLVVHTFCLRKELAKKGLNDVFIVGSAPAAQVGAPYRYKVKIQPQADGINFGLVSGPAGLTITPSGDLMWNTPERSGLEKIAVSLKDASGRESIDTLTIRVKTWSESQSGERGDSNSSALRSMYNALVEMRKTLNEQDQSAVERYNDIASFYASAKAAAQNGSSKSTSGK